MEKYIIRYVILFLISVNSPVLASENWRELCKSVSESAEQIMIHRQKGTEMSMLIEKAKNEEMIELVIISAYDKPRYSTEDMKQRTVEEFRDFWYLQCAKSFREK